VKLRTYLLAAVLLALVPVLARAQNTCTSPVVWCMTGVTVSVNGVAQPGAVTAPVGASITVGVSFSSTVAQTNETLGVSVWDPTKTTQLPSVGTWQTGVSFTAGQTIGAQAFTFTAPTTPGTYTIAAGVWNADGTTALYDGAAQTLLVTATAPPPFVPVLPPCFPKPPLYPHVDLDIPTQTPPISTRFTEYTVIVCQLPGGYITYADLFTPDASLWKVVRDYLAGIWTLAKAQADCMTSCVQGTASEEAFKQLLIAQYRPKAVVIPNGTNKTRPVYSTKADGTLNGTPVAGKAVPVGAACDETTRIPSASNFYSVAGQNDPTGTPLPPGSYTQCALTFPLAAN
jgi:hypothetical protein